MPVPFLQLLIALFSGISLIVLLTAKYRIHPFFALLLTCFLVGLCAGLPAGTIITATKDGFGNIMKSLGLIIVLGTTLGVILEYTGSTQVMAKYILKKTGEKKAPLAMSLTGFIVGLPIFCDSGYIVLNGLNQSLAKRTGISVVIMSVSLATGLYAVHCLIPPHPGASAAAGIIGADFGKLILTGIVIAVPAMFTGYAWARYAGNKIPPIAARDEPAATSALTPPGVLRAFLPVIVPIILIAIRSFLTINPGSPAAWQNVLSAAGDPVIALGIGVLLAFSVTFSWRKETVGILLQESAEKAGGILVIIGAGGAFGAVLAATNIGQYFNGPVTPGSMGLLFPFLLTALLKTAQGSSTVAIITASSIVLPLLHILGLDHDNGRMLCVLSMGAGSMLISHANDAYFWVIARFAGLDMRTMLRVYTVSTILMGLVSFFMVYILSFILR